ncbi:MAG: hypothetical protein A2X24_10610 [Chloroflexi bacterium GWB2_54_36]|nr:MAG: hypothetical protein A2X24_10610 [Chloroflexi bacterium GWB2_54_36]
MNAKRTVDDRALNRSVWQRMAKLLGERALNQPPRVLEVGAGMGTMLHRLVEWGALKRGTYQGIDSDTESIQTALQNLPAWADGQGLACLAAPDGFDLSGQEVQLRVSFQTREVGEVAANPGEPGYDLLLANAFLDLVNPASLLQQWGKWMQPGGLGYFTINFDGVTVFEPQLDPGLDEKIIELYHRSMDDRQADGQPTGGSRTGRRLYHQLRDAGWKVLAAGASDWVLYPVGGSYPADEAYFLEHILHFFEETLAGHAELEPVAFQGWLTARRRQIHGASLFLVVHQLDYLACWSPDDAHLPK